MSIKEVDLSEFTSAKSKGCIVTRALALLDEADREKFEVALETPTIPGARIATVWKSRTDTAPSASSVNNHRKKVCGCD